MNSKFKITIPKPCHENWNAMTPIEKGRFCSSCAKTVVDFTKKSAIEIQDYLVENKNEKVCGHFYKKQLDAIVIEIPQVTFHQQLSFQKLFILALFFVMGTTLFSCQYSNGKKQKIENIVIQDSIKILEEEISLIIPTENELDSVKNKASIIYEEEIITTTGISICDIFPEKETETFNLNEIEEIDLIDGDIEYEETGEIDNEVVLGLINQEYPRFKEAKDLNQQEAKKDFDKRIRSFVQDNFDSSLTECLNLSEGKYRIFSQITVDKSGNITDIKVRAPHSKLKKEVEKMLRKLPQLIPGKQRNKAVKTKYALPITFVVD